MKKFSQAIKEYQLYKKHFETNKIKSNLRLAWYRRELFGEEKCSWVVFMHFSDDHITKRMNLEIVL
jgi:hypothetical protein